MFVMIMRETAVGGAISSEVEGMTPFFSIVSKASSSFVFHFCKRQGDAGFSNVRAHNGSTLICCFVKIEVFDISLVLSRLQARGRRCLVGGISDG